MFHLFYGREQGSKGFGATVKIKSLEGIIQRRRPQPRPAGRASTAWLRGQTRAEGWLFVGGRFPREELWDQRAG